MFVCSPTPPRSFDGSSPNLVGVCRWTSELPLRSSFLKRSTAQRVNRSNVTFSEQTTPGWDHTAAKGTRARHLFPSKRHTVSKSLIPSTGIFTSCIKIKKNHYLNLNMVWAYQVDWIPSAILYVKLVTGFLFTPYVSTQLDYVTRLD